MPKVGDAIRLVERDGWFHVRTNGSHRVYIHPDKPGRVVIAGRASKDLPTGTWQSIPKQAGLNSRG
ncbi:MAG: type II toxin-antitoxin system HicA family toxin [Chloroflexota bacterium]|nr:type II toxin-antitoxin system HicA family toxin [Chloroflexota bacterium]